MAQHSLEDMAALALDWHRAGQGAALATVIETWGSAPRPAGSQLAIREDGTMFGSVSGGCVEGAVVTAACEAIRDGRPRLLEFGVADDDAFAVGLACGGTIRVLVQPTGTATGSLPPQILADLVALQASRTPVALLVNIDTHQVRLSTGPGDPLEPAIAQAMRDDRSVLSDDGWFIGVHNPPLRMAIVGAVHIAQALVPMARACGYDPLLIDPRGAFGSAARFPGETILDDWPDEALRAMSIDSRTAIITLTHDPKLDDPALQVALASPAFYVGCLGSRRTHAKRLERLRQAAIPEDAIARIHAPVGLGIGAKSPAEIAVSIMAEVTQRLRLGPASETP